MQTDLLDVVLHSQIGRASQIIFENAAWAWTVESSMFYHTTGQVRVAGGMGLPSQIIVIPNERWEIEKFVRAFAVTKHKAYATWRGLDTRFIRSHVNAQQFHVFCALETGARYLSQSALEFLLGRDQNWSIGAVLQGDKAVLMNTLPDMEKPDREETIKALMDYSHDEMLLALDFRKQMTNEAEPFRNQVAMGAYVLEHVPFRGMDDEFKWETMRLLILPAGIFASVEGDGYAAPFWWTPEGTNTAQVWYHPRAVFALDVMLGCIWRDACVIQERWAEKQAARGYSNGKRQHPTKPSVLVLPRIVYKSRWGTNAAERDQVERVARHAHEVRASYPILNGRESHSAAERAEEHHCPPPPPGRTFRRPHIRGEGTPSVHYQRVICRGLQVAHVILG